MDFFKTHKHLFILLVLPIILAGCGSTSAELSKLKDSGVIFLLESGSYDWGDINIKGGKVKKTFQLENRGQEDLILKSAQTSCMCTTAQFKSSDGEISPEFGMHTANQSWVYAVKPGEKFEVEVVFDPMAHGPDGVGPIQRSVFLLTSSKNNEFTKPDPQTGDNISKLDLKANVMSESEYNKKYNQQSNT